MENERFVNLYIEQLQNTLQDALLKNISMQVNIRIANEEQQNVGTQINSYNEVIEKLRAELNISRNTVSDDSNEISRLKNELDSVYNQLNALRNQVSHVDTFRLELQRAREEKDKMAGAYNARFEEQTHQHTNIINELNNQLQLLRDENKKLTDNQQIKVETIQPKLEKAKKVETPVEVVIKKGSKTDTLKVVETAKDGGTF